MDGRVACVALAAREPQDQLCCLHRHIELRAMADSVELDPIRVRQPFAVANSGAWERQELVFGAPYDPDRARDFLGV